MSSARAISVLAGVAAVLVSLAAGVAPAIAMCPNQALRAALHSEQLPDCRAYELVTPAQKYGWFPEFISGNGSRLAFSSIGAFSGSSGGAIYSPYEAVRSSNGWVSTPLEPSAGLSTAELKPFVEGSIDLREGLFEYQSRSTSLPGEHNLYVQSLPDGDSVEVGPKVPHQALVDNGGEGGQTSLPVVSDNLASVVFEIEGPVSYAPGDFLWPGDKTVRVEEESQGFPSLYEYRGTGNTAPSLVGVSDGRTVINGKTIPNGELIGQCGVTLGYPEARFKFNSVKTGESYNAVSADGSRIFFTVAAARGGAEGNACPLNGRTGAGSGPPADELFARTDESETTDVSEPTVEACKACDTSKPANAIFEGASRDGSKVFFLSEQELLPGGHGLNLYEYDFHAAKEGNGLVLVAPEVKGVARIAQNGSRVYFVSEGVLTPQANAYGASAKEGEANLYVYDTEDSQTAFIGTLAPGDSRDWQQQDERPVDASVDGRFLVFQSAADLTPDDTSTVTQVFEYDADARTLVRVSVGQNGFNENGNTNEYAAHIVYPAYAEGNSDPRRSSLSEDGSIVVFESSDALTPGAVVGYSNVYEYHTGQVSLISDGQDRSVNEERSPNVRLLGVDPTGADVFFTTADQLVPQDGDTQVDIYDARVDGGFAVAPPPSCEGEGCQGALAPAPAFGASQSATQPAEGSPPVVSMTPAITPKTSPKPRQRATSCRKGFARKHRRCVKRAAKRAVTTKRAITINKRGAKR